MQPRKSATMAIIASVLRDMMLCFLGGEEGWVDKRRRCWVVEEEEESGRWEEKKGAGGRTSI